MEISSLSHLCFIFLMDNSVYITAKITAEDIHNISSRMLKTKAAVAALGDLKNLPSLKDINADLVRKEKIRAQRFSLFS